MTVSLVGPQSINELKLLAVKYFSDVKRPEKEHDTKASEPIPTSTSSSSSSSSSYSSSSCLNTLDAHDTIDSLFRNLNNIRTYPFKETGVILRVRPVKDIRDISILWKVPRTRDHYRKRPFSFIGYLLGNKAPGSLHTQLQDRGVYTNTNTIIIIIIIIIILFNMNLVNSYYHILSFYFNKQYYYDYIYIYYIYLLFYNFSTKK